MNELKLFEQRSFKLESGMEIPDLKIAYQTFGDYNPEVNNVIWVFHALTANSNPLEWWPGLFGKHDYFNPQEHFIICVNIIGSPYGSSSPKNEDFPFFTTRDVVNSQLLLAQNLGIHQIKVAIGGSFGGSQALEFAYSFKGQIDNLILIACSAQETAWGIAIHEAQRMAMKADNSFGSEGGGKKGIKAARAIGMLTYRTSGSFIESQTDESDKIQDFKAASYIKYQGEKFAKRFDPLCYFFLTKCMDSHNISRGRESKKIALQKIKSHALVISIDTDVLLPKHLQLDLFKHLSNAQFAEIKSKYGHDGFLLETDQLSEIISTFLNQKNL